MACDRWFDALSAWVDGELDGDEAAELESHLAECADCRAAEGQLSSMRRRALLHAAVARPDLSAAIVGQIQVRRAANRSLARRAAVVATVAAALTVLAIPLTSSSDAPSTSQLAARKTTTVEVDQRTFSQREVDVVQGSTVRWQNRSGTMHRLVRKLPGTTVAGPLAPGQTESITFDEPGTYDYFCTIHDGMTGTVVVES